MVCIFSWSMIFLVGQLLTKSIKVGQNCRYPLTSFIKGPPYRDGPKWVQFDSNCLILSQLVIFCLIWSYFDILLTSYVKGHPCRHGPKVWGRGVGLQFVSYYLILPHLVSFCFIKSYFTLICIIYGMYF